MTNRTDTDDTAAPRLSPADRALLESGGQAEVYHHRHPRGGAACGWCAGWDSAAGSLTTDLVALLSVALAHRHAVTVIPHPELVHAAVVIHGGSCLGCVGRELAERPGGAE